MGKGQHPSRCCLYLGTWNPHGTWDTDDLTMWVLSQAVPPFCPSMSFEMWAGGFMSFVTYFLFLLYFWNVVGIFLCTVQFVSYLPAAGPTTFHLLTHFSRVCTSLDYQMPQIPNNSGCCLLLLLFAASQMLRPRLSLWLCFNVRLFKDMNIHPEIYKIMRLRCLRWHIQRILFGTTVSSGWCGQWTFWDFLLTTWVSLYFSFHLISVSAWTWDTKKCLAFRYSHNPFVIRCRVKVASRALTITQAWFQVLISHSSFYLHILGRVKKSSWVL